MKLDSLHASDYQAKLDKIDADVIKVQDAVRAKHPSSITAMLIWSNREIEIPKYEGLSEDDRILSSDGGNMSSERREKIE